MTSRPALWGAGLGSALAVFVLAVALVAFGPAPASGVIGPTPPGIAVSTPGASAGSATPGPDDTPTPQPTPPSTAKVQPRHSVGPKQLTGYGWPLKRAWITSRFAPRDFGQFIVIDGVGYHDGIDLATHCGDEVYATHDGIVLANDRTFDRYIGYQGKPGAIYERTVNNGNPKALAIAVVIDDGNGYRSLYMHLKEATVVPGQVVQRGDQIGIEGATGAATGCHVHYSLIRMDGEWQQVLPRLWKYGYPERIREHVNPIDVLPWGDEWAPLRLYNQIHPPSPSPTPGPPTATPSPLPTGTAPTPTPSASPRPQRRHRSRGGYVTPIDDITARRLSSRSRAHPGRRGHLPDPLRPADGARHRGGGHSLALSARSPAPQPTGWGRQGHKLRYVEVPLRQVLAAAVLVLVLAGLVVAIVYLTIPPGGPPTLR